MKKILYILLLLFAPFIYGQGEIVWDTDFDSVQWSVDGNTNLNIWELNDYTAFVVGSPREGTGAVQLKMASTYKRNEIFASTVIEPYFGREFWVGFSFKVVTPVPNSRIFMQFRQIGGPINKSINAIAFRMTGTGQWEIGHATDEAWYDYQFSIPEWGGAGTGHEHTSGLSYTLNQWHDIVLYMKINSYGNNQDGTLKIWHDGDLIVNKVNTTVHYIKTLDINTGDTGEILDKMTPTIGPYCGSLTRVGEIHYDTYKVWYGAGGTYEDVSPLGLSPGGSPTAVTSVETVPTTDKMLVAGTRQLYETVYPLVATDQTGEWSTDNGTVATVDSSTGLVTAQGTGTCTITFTTTDGSFTDTTAIEVESSSTEDSILVLEPHGYYDGTSGDADSWDDISGFEMHGVENGTITFTDQATFDGSSWYGITDVNDVMNYLPSTDSFTLIWREGDTSPTTSGYAISKADLSPRQYGASYSTGNFQSIYLGGSLEGSVLAPVTNPNRLFIAVIGPTQYNVWADGVQIITNSTAIGTGLSNSDVNIGGRTDGSYLMNNGATLDLVATIPKAISLAERQAIETEFQINGAGPADASIKATGNGSGAPYFYPDGTTKKRIN